MRRHATMADMYQYMKEVLAHFGLQFNEMHEVEVQYLEDSIRFTYGNESVQITTNYSKEG